MRWVSGLARTHPRRSQTMRRRGRASPGGRLTCARLKRDHIRRLLKPLNIASARKEGGPWGNQGFTRESERSEAEKQRDRLLPVSYSQMRFGVLSPTIRMSGGGGCLGYRPPRKVGNPSIEGSSKPAFGDHQRSPPEPGFARREAHNQKNRSKRDRLWRLLKRVSYATARKEGARGGTSGSPTLFEGS